MSEIAVDVVLDHRAATGLARGDQSGRALDPALRLPIRLEALRRADVPELRTHPAASRVHRFDHPSPAG